MINSWEVQETNEMIEKENLDVRTITLGISLLDCIDSDLDRLNQNIYKTIIPRNVRLAEAPSHGLPINLYDPRSSGAESYDLLAEEVIENGGEN